MSIEQSKPELPQASPSSLLGMLSRITVVALTSHLESMFNACDDLFFDLASRAKSNQDQNLYFESLREIRLRKSTIIADVGKIVADRFATIDRNARKPAKGQDKHQAPRPEDLELITQDQVEKDVLVTDMVSNARLDFQAELYQLHERMLQITPKRFELHANPFDPGQVTAAFVSACERADIELKILKLLYKQFDRDVLRLIADLYHRANQVLIDAHILPNLSPLSPRKAKKYDLPATPAAASPAAAAPNDESAGGIPVSSPEMQELAHLLGRLRSNGVRMPMFPNFPPAGTAGPPLARDELVSMLSEMQLQPAQQSSDGVTQPIDIRQAIESIMSSRGQVSVGRADEDIINVVAMFFDIILDDRNLPIEIQALVSRLQLPILKVALKDRSFFTDRKHPARQLINEIARTSIGWESSSKDTQDALFIRLTELVEQVLQSADDQSGIFEKCLSDLMGFIERNEQRVAKVEKRTAERAAADARTTKARDMVRHVLHERLEGKQLPTEITSFLVEDWQQFLQLVYLRQGKDSAEWIDAVQTVDDLVWSVQPHEDEKSRVRLERLLPDLDRRMAAGLEKTRSHADDARARLEVIREVQRKLLTPDSTPLPLEPLTPSQQEQITPQRSDEEKSWKEMTAVERQKVKYEALMYEFLKRVDDVPIGTWLLYDDLRRGATRRCKLSSRIDETRTFLFVNRVGVQVYEKPRKAFAYDMQMGHARIIEDTPLFDRTIERISSNLRKMAGDT